ncbi:MAG: DUF1731 domain-containing protein [Aquamicrobium sp.]|nr:DUF1731 domain-containing protein [Aquamicrobium sp.]
MRLFIFGAGYSGRAIARMAISDGAFVAGTTRSAHKAEELRAEGIAPALFDGGVLSPEIEAALGETTHLIVSIAPGDSDPVLAAARDTIVNRMPALRWIGYLSTVGVYGDHRGAWIDESAECRPVSRRSQARLAAERAWLALAVETDLPVAILRLSGIYGPGRNGFVNLEKGTARRIVKPDQVFNRIHVDDIAGATMLLANEAKGGIFNVTDDEPAPPQDVVAYAASLMGVAPPPEIPFDEAEMTPMARSFYGENKRVANARIKQAGYRFRFPDYRAALDDLWSSGTWRGRAESADARSRIGD